MKGKKYKNYNRIIMEDGRDRSPGQNRKSDQYITNYLSQRRKITLRQQGFLSDLYLQMDTEVYSNRIPKEAIKVVSENDRGAGKP